MILLGAAAIVGCFVFASFDKMTLAQQKEQIAQSVTAQLDALRVEKEMVCTETVTAEATTRFNTWVDEEAAKPAPKVGGKKKTYVKKSPTGPKVDPLPTTPPPPVVVDPKKSKMEGGSNVEEKAKKMEGQPSNTDKKKSKMGGGGN